MRKPLELPDTPHGSRYPRRSRLSVGVDIGDGFHPYPNHAGDMVPKIPTGSWMQGRLRGGGLFRRRPAQTDVPRWGVTINRLYPNVLTPDGSALAAQRCSESRGGEEDYDCTSLVLKKGKEKKLLEMSCLCMYV